MLCYHAIRQLPPGDFLVWQRGEIKTCRNYWQPNFGAVLDDITEEEAARHLLELLQDAVKIRMQCDVPYGARFLPSVNLLRILMVATWFLPLSSLVAPYYIKMGAFGLASTSAVILGVLSIALNFILVPRYAAVGRRWGRRWPPPLLAWQVSAWCWDYCF